jgi:hypothetical protein
MSLLKSKSQTFAISVATALALLLAAPASHARNLMSADGPGGTYELLQKAYTTELPDCGHMVPHITEEFDNELGKNVFVFHAHANLDDDRCRGKDRQRTEIRAQAADIVANNGETVYYRWKFKLPTGFQGSTGFTHIFQIKSDLGAPIMTLTPRVSTFEITGRAAGSSAKTELAKFIGVWVVVDLKVLFSDAGRIELNIRKRSDGTVLYSYAGAADMWDANASAHDSKFGIYRSLNNRAMLRDEQVRFADFCASKQSASDCDDGNAPGTDAGVGTVDGGASVDAGLDGGDGAGGANGTGGGGGTAGAGETGGATGSGGSGSGSGGTTSTPPVSDAATGMPRDTRPSTEPQPPTSGVGQTSACSCSLGARAGGGGGGWFGLLLFGFGAALWRRRAPR